MTRKSSSQDHNGNKGNHFLFFVSSWVVIGKFWTFANFKILYMYLKCVFNILLYCFMLLICDTKINNNKKMSTYQTAGGGGGGGGGGFCRGSTSLLSPQYVCGVGEGQWML